ncbi:hypothetical protein FQK02_05405 [Xanthomonas vasicola]|nr:hypothetical protein FQK02_05405 [Xanthomonas vasicola]
MNVCRHASFCRCMVGQPWVAFVLRAQPLSLARKYPLIVYLIKSPERAIPPYIRISLMKILFSIKHMLASRKSLKSSSWGLYM